MSFGTITNVYATGTVTATQADDNNTSAGGLVGFFDFGTISNSHTAVDVTAGAGSGVGGMAAYDFNGGVIENSYSTGTVIGGDNALVGGLVGFIYIAGTISNSFRKRKCLGRQQRRCGRTDRRYLCRHDLEFLRYGQRFRHGNGEYGGFIGNNNGRSRNPIRQARYRNPAVKPAAISAVSRAAKTKTAR